MKRARDSSFKINTHYDTRDKQRDEKHQDKTEYFNIFFNIILSHISNNHDNFGICLESRQLSELRTNQTNKSRTQTRKGCSNNVSQQSSILISGSKGAILLILVPSPAPNPAPIAQSQLLSLQGIRVLTVQPPIIPDPIGVPRTGIPDPAANPITPPIVASTTICSNEPPCA